LIAKLPVRRALIRADGDGVLPMSFRFCKERLLACLAVIVLVTNPASPAPTRTGVVVILPDDIGFDDISFFNSEGPRTPRIDALARESVRLTDFHASPSCAPTRAALLTGRYNNATGVWHTIMGRQRLRADEVTMADVFRANGYRTALIGKWHLGDSYPLRPCDRGFEQAILFRGGGVGQQPDVWGNTNRPPFTLLVNDRPEAVAAGSGFSTDVLTERAIAWLRERAERDEPFFLLAAWNVAHDPQDRPPDARAEADDRTATIENLDHNVGRLLDALTRTGRAENTVVIFFPDNGMASRGLRGGKATHWEGGHRVPCFLRWPRGGWGGGEAQAAEVDRLTAHIDLLPTLMDALALRDAGPRLPKASLHGRSLRTLLDRALGNDDPALLDRVLVVDNQRSARLERDKQASVMRDEVDGDGRVARKWRLSSGPGGTWSLHDVRADPRQQVDLSARSERTALIAGLKRAYDTWWQVVAEREGEDVRVVLGSEAQPRVRLDAHDWRTDRGDGAVAWHQGVVADGLSGNGFHAVTFARAGSWRFELRRWPEEIAAETTLTSALARPIAHRNGGGGGPTSGNALPIGAGRLRIRRADTTLADLRQTADGQADAVRFTVGGLPHGPAEIEAWFEDEAGRELGGAYYVYVERVTE
jgi:arylsulfatase A-like enzyme